VVYAKQHSEATTITAIMRLTTINGRTQQTFKGILAGYKSRKQREIK